MTIGDSRVEALIRGLPGEALVRRGVADLRAGRRTTAACAVAVARGRLEQSGITWDPQPLSREPEFELYELLLGEGGDAYSRYNAILRELVSFENALDRRLARGTSRTA